MSALKYILLLFLLLMLFALELLLGTVKIPMNDVLEILFGNSTENESWSLIVLESRLPRALGALLAGACLSVSGLMMQTLFRNPLAGPHILGVSAGSSLGVALLMMGLDTLGFTALHLLGKWSLILAAFVGSIGVLFILFLISLRVKDLMTVLIFGILIGSVSMAIVGILQYLSSEVQLKSFLIWTLGSFDGIELEDTWTLILMAFALLLLSIPLVKALNLLLTGEDYAKSMGVNVNRSRLFIMILAGAFTALITAYCGPIGFVGVVVPHFCRMIFKTYKHLDLILASVLIGAILMLFADLLSHLPWNNMVLPINSITSLIGIPFIFWMLIRRKMVAT